MLSSVAAATRHAAAPTSRRALSSLASKFSLTGTPEYEPNLTKYAGTYTVTLVPGDGVGKEMATTVKAVFAAAGCPVEWDQFDVTGESARRDPQLAKAAIDSLKHHRVGLKGTLATPVATYGAPSFNVAMRKELDMYASVSLVGKLEGFHPPKTPVHKAPIDFVIIRENTEGEYSGLEHQSYPGVVESLKVVTRAKTERIARFAFDFAARNGRKKVTCVHKANIMKLGDGLFLNTCREIAQEYAARGIKFEDMIVDNTAMQLVAKPGQFDVVVTGNLYGNIISNLGAALVGGPGIVPGANIGREHAVFEPGCRHVGADIAGTNVANPSALLLSAVLMLRHLHLDQHADRIQSALFKTLGEGVRTRDLGGNASTTEFTKAIIANLEA
ncbi:isocitrate dehydrogenase (NAD(+)) idh1 [Allomyces javanicus]|nr:isocitrate dehydrogenase (NAD(+)) idh1 [Allomyces javanicus]KAJ3367968.1 isocitrate dehydrogenase (NAD(+)) idh1 [Allomyces arbusculus]